MFDCILHTQDVTCTFDSSSERPKQTHRTPGKQMACMTEAFFAG